MRYLMLFLMLCGLAIADYDFKGSPLINPIKYEGSQVPTTAIVVDTAGDYAGAVWIAKSTQNVSSVWFYITAGGTEAATKITAYIDHVGAGGFPDGTHHATQEITGGWTFAAWNQITFASPFEVVAGTAYAIYVTCTSADLGANHVHISCTTMSRGTSLFPVAISNTGSDAKIGNGTKPMVVPVYADGTIPKGFCIDFAASLLLASDHAADEYAMAFSVANTTEVVGALVYVALASDVADFSVVFYEATTALYTIAFDEDALAANSYGWIYVEWPAYAAHAGHVYRVSVLPGTTTDLTLLNHVFPSVALMNLWNGQTMYGSSRVDAGAWTDYNSGTFTSMGMIPLLGNMTISSSTAIMSNMNGGF
jgi:hypothetical protein